MEQRTIQTQESAERIDALLAHSGYTRSAAARLIELIEKPRTTVMDRTVVTGALLPGGTVASPRTE